MSFVLPRAFLLTEDGTEVSIQSNCSFGRSSANVVIIQSAKASRWHAFIHAQEGEYWLVDLGSVNGTFLNQQRVLRPVRLRDGNSITIADKTFRFQQWSDERTKGAVSCNESQVTVLEVRDQNCWLLLADVANYTALSLQLPTEELAILVGKWVRSNRDAVEEHGGLVKKFLGDGYLALWPDGADAVAKVALAISALLRLQRTNNPEFRVVIHYGKIGLGGSSALGDELIMGSEVNFIFRLEKLAAGLKVPFALSAAAQLRLASLVRIEAVPGEHCLKGFDGTHRVFSVRPAEPSPVG